MNALPEPFHGKRSAMLRPSAFQAGCRGFESRLPLSSLNRLFTGSPQAASWQAGGFMLCEKVYSDILPHFAYCLTKNLPLSSSQTHLHSKWFPILQQGHLFAHVPLHKEPKL